MTLPIPTDPKLIGGGIVGLLLLVGLSFGAIQVFDDDSELDYFSIIGGDDVVTIDESFLVYALHGDDISGEFEVEADRWLEVDDIKYTIMHSTEPQSIEITENKNQPIIDSHTFEDTLPASSYDGVIDDGVWNVEAEFKIDVKPLYHDFSNSIEREMFTSRYGSSFLEHRETDFGEGYLRQTSSGSWVSAYRVEYNDDINFDHGKDYTISLDLEASDSSDDQVIKIAGHTFDTTAPASGERFDLELEMESQDEQDKWDARLYRDGDEIEQETLEISSATTIGFAMDERYGDTTKIYSWEILEDNSRLTYDIMTATEEFSINVEPSAETTIIEPQYVADLDEGFTVEVESESDREKDSFTYAELMIRDSENPSDELVRELEQVEFNDDGTPVTAMLEYDVIPEEDLEGFSDDVQEFEVEAFVEWQDAGKTTDTFYIDRDDGDITEDPQVGEGTNGDSDGSNTITEVITGDFTESGSNQLIIVGLLLAMAIIGGAFIVSQS